MSTALTVRVRFETFDEWWASYLEVVGPAGVYVAGLDAPGREALREHCRELLTPEPFEIPASAWCVVGRAG